uniref:Uncharacterized protein n=1 Tax=Anguilla anguilla TaxID=7936 RepID=A0A0E9SWP6_ANGAN
MCLRTVKCALMINMMSRKLGHDRHGNLHLSALAAIHKLVDVGLIAKPSHRGNSHCTMTM